MGEELQEWKETQANWLPEREGDLDLHSVGSGCPGDNQLQPQGRVCLAGGGGEKPTLRARLAGRMLRTSGNDRIQGHFYPQTWQEHPFSHREEGRPR